MPLNDSPSYDHYVLISLDTLRSDGIAANPYKLWPAKYKVADPPQTPMLDKMVAEGTFFPNCVSAAPYTSASHASILTGKWPANHHVVEFFNHRLRSRTVFAWARKLGFRTYLKSDFPLILGPHLGFSDDVDNYIVEDDEQYLSDLDLRHPTFSLVHYGSLHAPYGFHNLHYGGDAYRQRVAELEAELGPREIELADLLVETYRSGEDLDLLLRYKRIIGAHYGNGNYDRLFSLYVEGITHFMRTRFEPFISRLVEKFDGQRALFVIFGDHGEEYDVNCFGHFNSMAEGVIRVPVLFWGPDVVAQICPTRMRTVDVAPTLRSCLGARVDGLDGVSLADTVFDKGSYPARPAFCQSYISKTQNFVEFQQKLLRTGRKTGSLPHVCFAEAVYNDDMKLSRQNYVYENASAGTTFSLAKREPLIGLERIGEDLIPRTVSGSPARAALLDMLNAYGQLTARRGAAVDEPGRDEPEVTEDIRLQLRAMGYDI
jgi:choline-sulfatase